MRELKKDIVALVAYLIGVGRDFLSNHYPNSVDYFNELDSVKEARIIRNLCKLRMTLFVNFVSVDNELNHNMKCISEIDLFSTADVLQLEKWGVNVNHYNSRANRQMWDFNEKIADNIENCRDMFPPWVEWDYIKNLFIMPKGNDDVSIKSEFVKYITNKRNYPFQRYINWRPKDYGNFLLNDRKFLKILYSQNGSYFYENSKVLDAGEEIRDSIYDFIHENKSTDIVVDCENSDVYKLYAVLKSFNPNEISKIEKIILYDDIHTTDAWTLLEGFTDIKVEHIEVERIKENKSLVDIRMTAGVCTEFYKNNVGSFILLSSDSDFWGLISSLPEAEFLVMAEYEKCGKDIKEALRNSKIPYCFIDDFCSSGIEDLKNEALLTELRALLVDVLPLNGKDLLDSVYTSCRISATEMEKRKFYERYIRTLKLMIDLDGGFSITVKD